MPGKIEDQPVRLVEQSWRKGDPDPKALACYGVLWQQGTPDEPDPFADVAALCDRRPVSAITTQFLEWCCQRLLKQGKTTWLLIWDNASLHVSQDRAHLDPRAQLSRSSRRAKACAFCLSFCPPKVPGSIPSSPSGSMPSATSSNPTGCSLLSQLAERVCAHFGCSYEPHLFIPEKVA